MKKYVSLIAGLIGLAGLLAVLFLTCIKNNINQGEWILLILAVAICMVLIGCGVHGFDRAILLNRYPRTPEGRAKFIKDSLAGKESGLRKWIREFYYKHLS